MPKWQIALLFHFPLLSTLASEQGIQSSVQAAPWTEPPSHPHGLHLLRGGWVPHTAVFPWLEDANPFLYPDSSAQVICRQQCFNWHFSVKSANRFKTRYTQAVECTSSARQYYDGWSFVSLGNFLTSFLKTQNVAAVIKLKIKRMENGSFSVFLVTE